MWAIYAVEKIETKEENAAAQIELVWALIYHHTCWQLQNKIQLPSKLISESFMEQL